MAVFVTVHSVARPGMAEWTRRLAPDPHDSFRLAEDYYQSIVEELIRSSGRPEHARRVPNIDPEVWVWEFQTGAYWLIYTIRGQGNMLARWLRMATIAIIILGIQSQDPSQEDVETLTRALRLRG